MLNLIAKLRRNRRLARGLLAVWLVAWLQTALLPCTMAATMAMGGPDMPQTMQHSMEHSMDGAVMDHSGMVHDMAMSDMEMAEMDAGRDGHDCPYCPPHHDANDDAQLCTHARALQLDARGLTQLQLDNLAHAAHVMWVDVTWQAAAPRLDAGPPPRYAIPIPKTRPVALTYCVQLK